MRHRRQSFDDSHLDDFRLVDSHFDDFYLVDSRFDDFSFDDSRIDDTSIGKFGDTIFDAYYPNFVPEVGSPVI